MRASAGYHLYHRARARAEDAVAALRGLAENLEIAGSLRRRREVIRDIDLVATAREPAALAAAFRELPGVTEVTADGPTKVSVRFHDGLSADLRVVAPEEFPAALLYFTGSKEHNTELRGRARRMGLKLNEYGLYAERRRAPRALRDRGGHLPRARSRLHRAGAARGAGGDRGGRDAASCRSSSRLRISGA